jgi:hypothetical protein
MVARRLESRSHQPSTMGLKEGVFQLYKRLCFVSPKPVFLLS